LATLKAD